MDFSTPKIYLCRRKLENNDIFSCGLISLRKLRLYIFSFR